MILERIAKETGVNIHYLGVTVATAKHRYRTYFIRKRTGGRRVISHPTPEVKFLQRWMNRNIFALLPIHDAATAYKRGSSIAKNAKIHVSKKYLLKIDFHDFFPSITSGDVRSLLREHADKFTPPLSDVDVNVILNTVCKNDALTIGAPSSPIISNAILYAFDCFAYEICREHNASYSRYADDIFISTDEPNVLSALLVTIRADLASRPYPTLRINDDKTVFTSKKRKRVITGVVLTPDNKLSIGRQKKRQIRNQIYLYKQSALAPADVSYLRGFLAYVSAVEPEMIVRLRRKFGDDLLDRLMREEVVRRKPGLPYFNLR